MVAADLIARDVHLRSVRVSCDHGLHELDVERFTHLAVPSALVRLEPVAYWIVAAFPQRLDQRHEVLTVARHWHGDMVAQSPASCTGDQAKPIGGG